MMENLPYSGPQTQIISRLSVSPALPLPIHHPPSSDIPSLSMGYEAMSLDPSSPSIPRDIAKKKKMNKSAKLKQCKLDARREQWLSQVKERVMASSLPLPARGSHSAATPPDGLGLVDSDAESLSPSPVYSPTPSASAKPPRKCRRCPPQNSTSSGSSIGSCSRSVSDAEEQDDGEKGGLDDWEAVADALSADGDPARRLNLDPVVVVAPKTEGRAIPRAWRPDDVFRPQSLPNLSKQRGFPASMERRYAGRGILPVPSSCPICYEDLDLTDSSFLPCSCGFHLCLFCHKRILEEDGRCPGCRKQYVPLLGGETGGGGVPPMVYHLSRSCSLRSRT